MFDKLQRLCPGRANARFLIVAVSDNVIDNLSNYLDDDLSLAGPRIPDWHDQLDSFIRDRVANCLRMEYDKYIKQIIVKSVTFDGLLRLCTIKCIDVLRVDAEGYDCFIIRKPDLSQACPRLVLFKNKYLTASEISKFFCKYSPRYNITNLVADCLCAIKRRGL